MTQEPSQNNARTPRTMTMAEKILARASGREEVRPFDYVTADLDLAMGHESMGGAFLGMMKAGVDRVWDGGKIAVALDHYTPAPDEKAAGLHAFILATTRKLGIGNFYGEGYGICHRVLPEEGLVLPGMLIVGADSHATTYGALGAAGTGIGMSEMAYVLATGRLWFMVPETIRVDLAGSWPELVTAKDAVLALAGQWGADFAQYQSLEFSGPAAKTLEADGRMTMSNMAVELGAKFGMFAADNVTADWLQTMAGKHSPPFGPDEEAEYANILELDVAALTPMVAAPHSVDNVKPASELGGVKIDQAVLGGCANGHLSDLRLAANLMKGKKVHSDLRFLVIPASRKVELAALREGLLEALLESGAMLCPPTCGNCFGNHVGILAAGQKCISATNRNFKGRMGSPQAEIYLASPATVAASAITGRITDPRQL